MIWSHQSTYSLFEEQCTTDLSLTELLNIYTGWCYHINHHIKIQDMLTPWRAISNWIYLDTFPQYIQGWCDHIIHMITHQKYDHINDMITSTIWSHIRYDYIDDMITLISNIWLTGNQANMAIYVEWRWSHPNIIFIMWQLIW